MSDCLFCKIAAKEVDAKIVAETSNVVVFEDINPAAPTHLLVIPKVHIASAVDLGDGDGELLQEIFTTMARLASERSLDGGVRIVTNVGPDAGQSVHHLHFHLIGGRSMAWPPG